ncbi:type VI secretion system baseplate subunit TssK [Larsenimonas rhizosphaerae]|uniref:Type VI secretion system baseplate subunit TssK n=1 Tax=Larsenimonas rhizosphaerae TaxID=2944682 RepID=A0AA41ZET2_9GAMM|nr:type VI secretion system baseplate subunit TssK [Larsenimonas rhizosphaerae]MCM2130793.1 type VI secretion system baseplate subunit TssK [Larsenimonas rhizosphaerae]MCX2523497.1 type VI secretion system baseplate subunit TssK [Larsenimonas rhizosphaerae]
MSKHNRIMWSEGMFLLPQHFQYQDEFHQRQQAAARQSQTPFHWGVQQLTVDEGALEQGTLRLTRLKMVFPDGTLMDAPQHDPLPLGRDLNELSRNTEVLIHAALKVVEPWAPSYLNENVPRNGNRRFIQRFDTMVDLNEGSLENELGMLELNVTLLMEGDSLDGYTSCPIALLKRNAAGGFSLETREFMPPSLHLSSSSLPLEIGNRLVGMLQARSEALSGRRRERADQVAEFGSSDVTLFWLLYTINRAYPQLSHLIAHTGCHPERLYRFLAELAASLMTFSMSHALADIPEYDHHNPAPSLLKLEQVVRELLDVVVPNQYIPIPLEQTRPSYYMGRLNDARLKDADFYISVHADMPGARILELVPRAFKVGSPEDIEVVVNTAMPGGTLTHAPRLPSAIPARLDNHYFALEPHGSVYERMMKAQAIAFYVPSGFTNLSIELMAVMK